MNGKAAFLFGSGISYKSGGPTVADVTESLFERRWREGTDRSFYPLAPNCCDEPVGVSETVKAFLRILRAHVEPHIGERESRGVNYEDLYSAVQQMVCDETRELTNPLISISIARIKDATSFLWVNFPAHIGSNQFASLADRAGDFIQWVVCHKLCAIKTPLGVDALRDAIGAFESVDIFTLNHDNLLEAALADWAVPFCDGFGELDGDRRVFNWSWRQSAHSVSLLKLHGSVDWYLFRFDGYDQFARVAGAAPCRDRHGNWVEPLQTKPMFLTGTTTKELEYGTGLFGEIFLEFRSRLARHHTLICCGYGWNDKGINIRLSQWLRDAPKNRVVILHDTPPEELQRKRFWYWRWEDYVKLGKVVLINKWLCDTKLSDLESFLESDESRKP